MKKIYTMLMALATAAITFTSCSDSNDAFFTAGEDDYPRILNTDIPEATGGGRANLPAITRNNNFKFNVIVTPADYTTVTWFIDGVEVFEGKTIDYSLIAGTYDVDIVATTTKGKTTKRMCSLEVLPVEGDPTLASDAKNLWCQIGTEKTMNVSDFEGVTSMTIGGQALADFQNNGTTITFTVPALTEGNQKVVVVKDGKEYGCGNVTISSEKYVDPGVQTVTLWEGTTDISWGDSNVQLSTELADVPVGAKIVLHYEMITADYHALRVTNQEWSSDIVAQVDGIDGAYPESYEFTYTADAKALVDAGCMVITGFGYKLTSVTAEWGAPSETTLWEGATDINWGDSNVNIAPELLEGAEGKTICLYYDVPEAEYHAMRICGPWWDGDLVEQFDITDETPNPYEFEYTAERKGIVDEQGGMLVVGFGYTLTKVTYK